MSTSHPSSSDAAALASLAPGPAERDMPPGRQQALMEYLMNEVSEPASPGAHSRHRLPGRGPRRLRLSRPAWMMGMVATVSVVAVAIALTNIFTSRSPMVGSSQGGPMVGSSGELAVNWSQPLINAHKVTLAGAAKALGFAIPMPAVGSVIRAGGAAPNQIRLATGPVWVAGPEAALTFNRGEVTILVGRATYTNPGRTYRTSLAEIKVGRAAIGRVNGTPAFIGQPRTDYTKSNPAIVVFDLHGLDIEVISTRLGTSLLTAIAESIKG